MTKTLITLGAAVCAARVFAGLYGDTPDAKHAWAVHDMNRPNPVKITAQPGLPPSDAVILFDGSKASFEQNWRGRDGKPSKWAYDAAEGSFGLEPDNSKKGWYAKKVGPIFTRKEFGDCQLHLEFKYPKDLPGKGQMRGNSGVFLMSNYEIQVMDSFDTDPANNTNPNYADGQCGAVYAENPPLVNACRKPGEWSTYDIVFHQPVWNGNTLVHPGSVTVFLNGVLVQDHWEMEGLTTHCKRRPLAPHASVGPLQLQDHGCPLSYRNVWYRPIPSRWANTTHSVMSANEAAVMAQRRATAEMLWKKIAKPEEISCPNVCALAEVISYAKEGKYEAQWKASAAGLRDALGKMDDKTLNARKGNILAVRKCLAVLIRNKVIPETCTLNAKINEIAKRLGWK